MIKLFVLTILIIIGGSCSAFAVPNHKTDLLTAKERNHLPYVRFPDWQNIVIVDNDHVNQEYLPLISTAGWDSDINLADMELVQLREFDVSAKNAKIEDDQVVIAYGVSLQFKDDGLIGTVVQGTLDAIGEIILKVQSDEGITVTVLEYGTSDRSENLGNDLGLLEKFDGHFVEGIVAPSLAHYLEKDDNLAKLIALLGDNGIQLP